jgi:hypothetical protein
VRVPVTGLLRAASVILVALSLACGQSRAEGRRARLDTFREALPADVKAAFDSIASVGDCPRVGEMLAAARAADPRVDAVIDSIVHAELIDCFTDTEIVEFFWVYFDDALERGLVPEP